jgi:hypothetical protein
MGKIAQTVVTRGKVCARDFAVAIWHYWSFRE